MKYFLRRIKYKISLFNSLEDILNRRAEVENELYEIARGKRELPTREDCHRMAVRLGVPT